MSVEELNRLEREIAAAEDGAEDRRWAQAELVSTLVENLTLSAVAEGWIRVRTGEPYGTAHVGFVHKAWRRYGGLPADQRPKFATAYREAQGKIRSPEERALAAIRRLPRAITPLSRGLPDVPEWDRRELQGQVHVAVKILTGLLTRMKAWDANVGVDPALARDIERLRISGPPGAAA